MPISKISGISFQDIAKIDGVSANSIESFSGVTASAAPAGIVTTDLIFHIDPNNSSSYPGSGSTIYDLVGTENGTFSGGTYVDASGHLRLDGVNDYIDFGTVGSSDPVSLYNTDWSISAWAHNYDSGETFQYFWSQWSNSAGSNRFDFLRSTGADSLAFRVDVSSAIQVGVASGFPANAWHYMTATFNSSTNAMNIYRDGTLVASGTSQGPSSNTKRFKIGSNGWSGSKNEFNGKLGAFHVYDREITSSEITQNYNATKSDYGL